MIAEGVEPPAERPGKDIVMCLLELNAPRVWGIMSKLVALERRILILEKSQPEPVPWSPKLRTMSYDFYQDLVQPNERMGFMEMYLLAAEQFYEARCN